MSLETIQRGIVDGNGRAVRVEDPLAGAAPLQEKPSVVVDEHSEAERSDGEAFVKVKPVVMSQLRWA